MRAQFASGIITAQRRVKLVQELLQVSSGCTDKEGTAGRAAGWRAPCPWHGSRGPGTSAGMQSTSVPTPLLSPPTGSGVGQGAAQGQGQEILAEGEQLQRHGAGVCVHILLWGVWLEKSPRVCLQLQLCGC